MFLSHFSMFFTNSIHFYCICVSAEISEVDISRTWPNKTKTICRSGNVYFCLIWLNGLKSRWITLPDVSKVATATRSVSAAVYVSLSGPLLPVIGSVNGIHGIFLPLPQPLSPSISIFFFVFFLSNFRPETPLRLYTDTRHQQSMIRRLSGGTS